MKKHYMVPFLHFEGGPGIPLSNFDWSPGDPTCIP